MQLSTYLSLYFIDIYGHLSFSFFFFFNDTATTEIYTLSLHDALPIFLTHNETSTGLTNPLRELARVGRDAGDRKSTRLNSSHDQISYAVFCLKKKNQANLAPPGFSRAALASPPTVSAERILAACRTQL